MNRLRTPFSATTVLRKLFQLTPGPKLKGVRSNGFDAKHERGFPFG
jgi:hypothetical protein